MWYRQQGNDDRDRLAGDLGVSADVVTVPYRFPDTPSNVPEEPAIYFWHVDGEPIYVGETEDLKKRMGGYARPGRSQATNQRMHDALVQWQNAGSAVELRVLGPISLSIGGAAAVAGLRDKHLRVALEELCIWLIERGGRRLENL